VRLRLLHLFLFRVEIERSKEMALDWWKATIRSRSFWRTSSITSFTFAGIALVSDSLKF
jgi:hypothetical protein